MTEVFVHPGGKWLVAEGHNTPIDEGAGGTIRESRVNGGDESAVYAVYRRAGAAVWDDPSRAK